MDNLNEQILRAKQLMGIITEQSDWGKDYYKDDEGNITMGLGNSNVVIFASREHSKNQSKDGKCSTGNCDWWAVAKAKPHENNQKQGSFWIIHCYDCPNNMDLDGMYRMYEPKKYQFETKEEAYKELGKILKMDTTQYMDKYEYYKWGPQE